MPPVTTKVVLAGAGQAHAQPADHRRPGRRLPPARRRDGVARPRRRRRAGRDPGAAAAGATRLARDGRRPSGRSLHGRAGRTTTSWPGRWPWPTGRADVRIVKHIPAGAGLGGGSSDAAAVLAWAGIHDLEPGRLDRRRRAVLPGRGPGAGARHRRARRTAPVRGTRPSRCSRRRSAARRPPSTERWDELGGPHDGGEEPVNDLETGRAVGRAPAGRVARPARRRHRRRHPGWRGAARPGSSKGRSPATADWSLAPRRPAAAAVRRRQPDGVGEPAPVLDVELLGAGLGRDAGRGERLGARPRRPATAAASCAAGRTQCAPARTGGSGRRRRPAPGGARSRAAPTRPWAGAGTPSAARGRPPWPSPSRRPSPTGCRRRPSPGPAARRSPASRCTITSIRPMRGTSSSRSHSNGVATL